MTSSRTPVLLLTAAGTGTGYGYALAFARHVPQGQLITADTNPKGLVSAAVFAENHVQLPPFHATDDYISLLNETIRAHGVTHYLPLIDPEIAFAAQTHGKIEAHCITPNADFVSLAINKQSYASRLEPLELPTPRTIRSDEVSSHLPCFAKLPGGFGGRACWRIEREEDLLTLPSGHFLQEIVAGPEFTADCFPTGDSRVLICSVRERLEIKSGVCTKARIAPHPVIESYARRLVEAYRIESPFCFQAIGSTAPAITDINPRLGAGTAMSGANGMDFFAAHMNRVFGAQWDSHMQRLLPTCFVTRQYVEYVSTAE